LVNTAELDSSWGDSAAAVAAYQKILADPEMGGHPLVAVHLQGVFGDICRDQGRVDEALAAYRDAADSYTDLGMSLSAAQLRLSVADLLLSSNRFDEAEKEILAALPV